MKIFRIKHDSNRVPRLIPVSNMYFDFKCQSKKKDWLPYEVYNADPIKETKNFYSLGMYGVLVFDEHALEICRPVFEMAGEILPIKVERGADLFLLNTTRCLDVLNYDTTMWDYYDNGVKGRILKFGFHPQRVLCETSIFKIPEVINTHIFCYADVKNPDDEFYHIYHKHKLTGLIFEEVYNELEKTAE